MKSLDEIRIGGTDDTLLDTLEQGANGHSRLAASHKLRTGSIPILIGNRKVFLQPPQLHCLGLERLIGEGLFPPLEEGLEHVLKDHGSEWHGQLGWRSGLDGFPCLRHHVDGLQHRARPVDTKVNDETLIQLEYRQRILVAEH